MNLIQVILKNYIINFKELQSRAEKFSSLFEQMSPAVKSVININFLQESESWIVEFNNILNPLLKDARKSLKETEKVAKFFRNAKISVIWLK